MTSAKDWILRWCGKTGYDRFWKTLLEYKFYEYADTISAAWIWTRIKRVSSSRQSIMQEELGYIDGGSQVLIDALVSAITAGGGKIHLGSPAIKVIVENQCVTGVRTPDKLFAATRVLSTISTPMVANLVPELPEAWKARYDSIHNIGICCVIFKLGRSVSPYFWINIGQMDHQIPGVIEFSNLREVDDTVVYVPYYMPTSNPKFAWTDEAFVDDSFACLAELNPSLKRGDIIDVRVTRLRHAQPVCDVGFAAKIPPIQTPIEGLQIADTSFYYPEDRGIAESVRVGRQMARMASA